MASIESILRRGVSNTILLARARRRHPGCRVDSVLVDPGASLADHVRIAHDVEIRANVSVGRWTYIEPYTFVNGAEIGSFCAIGRNAAIGCFEHPYTYPAVSAKLYHDLLGLDYDDSAPPVRIGSDVWIGEKAVILRGGGRSRCNRWCRRRGDERCPSVRDSRRSPCADHRVALRR